MFKKRKASSLASKINWKPYTQRRLLTAAYSGDNDILECSQIAKRVNVEGIRRGLTVDNAGGEAGDVDKLLHFDALCHADGNETDVILPGLYCLSPRTGWHIAVAISDYNSSCQSAEVAWIAEAWLKTLLLFLQSKSLSRRFDVRIAKILHDN